MNRLSKVASETDEDLDVWLWIAMLRRVRGRPAKVRQLCECYQQCDVKDAQLMWEAQLSRGANPYNPAGIVTREHLCGARWYPSHVSWSGHLVWGAVP